MKNLHKVDPSNPYVFKRLWGPVPNYPQVLKYENTLELPIIIAGPCFVDNERVIEETCRSLMHYDAITYIRGGVFRAGTYPPENFGLDMQRLKVFSQIAKDCGKKIIVEVLDIRTLDTILKYADALQIGDRASQNYALLEELGKTDRVVTLKRGHGQTLDEFLGSAEYLLRGGKCKPVLIERGGVSFLNHVRWDLSISLIAAVKKICDVPILVDASHGTGRSDLVIPMTMAGLAAGADGFLMEVHPNPSQSISDSEQALTIDTLQKFLDNESI
jgi:3-deoxy-7-phosphoheptulonate synthase